MSNGSVSPKISEIPPSFPISRVTIQEGVRGNRWFPRCEGKKNYFWIAYPMACFSASSEPVLMQFQGFLGSKQVNSPHGVILIPIKSVAGLGVNRNYSAFLETMIVDHPSLHFFCMVCHFR